jgi:hypothetical protein
MFKKYKQFVIGFLIGSVIFSSTSVFAETQTLNAFFNNIKVSINNQLIELKDANGNPIEPFIVNGTTYLPVRILAENLGMEVKFNESSNTVELTKKEESALNEITNPTTPTPTKSKPNNTVTFSEENGLQIAEVSGKKLIEVDSIKTKFSNSNYRLHIGGNYVVIKKLINGEYKEYSEIIFLKNDLAKELIGKNYIEYNDYISKIKPLIGE